MTSKYEALKAEARGSSLFFEFGGFDYKLEGPWDYKTLDLVIEGRRIAAVKHLLGKEQYRQFRLFYSTSDELDLLIEASLEGCGISKDSFWGLVRVITDDKLFGLFEVDCLRTNIDISQFFTGELSLRTLAMLFETLPYESETMKEYIGETAEWSRVEYMLADIMDTLTNSFRMQHITAQMNGYRETYRAAKPVFVRPGNKVQEAEAEKKVFTPTSVLKDIINPNRYVEPATMERFSDENGFTTNILIEVPDGKKH